MILNPVSKAIFITVAVFSPFSIRAATWLGGSNAYTVATEWDTNAIPAVTENITIAAGTATNTGNLTRNAITNLSGTGELVVQNGRFMSGGTVNIGDNAKLTVTGNYFLVGNTSIGTLNQTGGTVTATLDRGFFLSDNTGQAGSVYNLFGGTLSVTNNGSTNDTNLFAVHIGKGGPGDVFTINGGAATFVNIATASRNVWISRSSTFHLISGSASFTGYDKFTIGFGGSVAGTSEVWVEGGTFVVSNLLNNFTLGEADNGKFTLEGGIVEIESSIVLGGTAGTSGTIVMEDGTLTAVDIFAGPGNALFDFNGGEIILNGDRTSIVDEPWFDEAPGTQAVYDAENNVTHVTVPEPSSFALVALSMTFLGIRRKR